MTMHSLTCSILLCFALALSGSSGQMNKTCIQPMLAAADALERLIDCPEGWYLHNGACYAFVNLPMSWNNAELFCEKKGGHLASIHSDVENNFVRQLTRNPATGSYPHAYIGGHKLPINTWAWTDGTLMDYTDWAADRPDNWGGNENCIHIVSVAADWNDIYCAAEFAFVCKAK
ncbi:C-type lectin 1 [Arapaima gigas]